MEHISCPERRPDDPEVRFRNAVPPGSGIMFRRTEKDGNTQVRVYALVKNEEIPVTVFAARILGLGYKFEDGPGTFYIPEREMPDCTDEEFVYDLASQVYGVATDLVCTPQGDAASHEELLRRFRVFVPEGGTMKLQGWPHEQHIHLSVYFEIGAECVDLTELAGAIMKMTFEYDDGAKKKVIPLVSMDYGTDLVRNLAIKVYGDGEKLICQQEA